LSAKCHLRPSLRRKKVASHFAVTDEPPYGTRCRERALSTTSRRDTRLCFEVKLIRNLPNRPGALSIFIGLIGLLLVVGSLAVTWE
jgi:hypothetical protein